MIDIQIKATIYGNHQSPDGNPIPKPRMTRKDKYDPSKAATRYFDYANWLRYQLIGVPIVAANSKDCDKPADGYSDWLRNIANAIKLHRSPFTSSAKVKWSVKLWIGLKGDNYGDEDNIVKSFKDVFFKQDKWVSVKLQENPELIPRSSKKQPYLRFEMVREELL